LVQEQKPVERKEEIINNKNNNDDNELPYIFYENKKELYPKNY
jgi:hypothetical protein